MGNPNILRGKLPYVTGNDIHCSSNDIHCSSNYRVNRSISVRSRVTNECKSKYFSTLSARNEAKKRYEEKVIACGLKNDPYVVEDGCMGRVSRD